MDPKLSIVLISLSVIVLLWKTIARVRANRLRSRQFKGSKSEQDPT